MVDVLTRPKPVPNYPDTSDADRPAWIPLDIVANWDPSPYAYQTPEEQMPGGGAHGVLMGYIYEVLEHFLRGRDLMLMLDMFMLYRDTSETGGIKRRISPDLLFLAAESPPPSAYDLDDRPAPVCLGEIVSPDSRQSDVETKRALYTALGVQRYFVIDALEAKGAVSDQVRIRVWYLGMEQRPDADGFLLLPELGVKVRPVESQVRFFELESSEPLPDAAAWARLTEELQADLEAKDREIENLKAELERLRGGA